MIYQQQSASQTRQHAGPLGIPIEVMCWWLHRTTVEHYQSLLFILDLLFQTK